MTRHLFVLTTVIAVGLVATASAVTLNEVARFDIDTATIGSNPAVVTWNGSRLYAAGWNASGMAAPISIVEITNGTAIGLQTATYGTDFGVLTAENNRGYSGLDISGGTIAAAADPVGATIPEGISVYGLGGGAALWAKSQRGGSGVGFDPGFGGVDSGVGHTTFGSGRRALQNSGTGADIYTSANGMIINGTGTGTFWRDMDFAPNGDIWLREGNNVIQGVRNGGNSLSATNLVADEPEADFVPLQTLAYMDGAVGGDLVIYNDREVPNVGQVFTDVVKVIDPAGVVQPLNLNLLAPVMDGVGAYDFSWDGSSGTLAISDFANRNIHIFGVVPEPGSVSLLVLGLLVVLGMQRKT